MAISFREFPWYVQLLIFFLLAVLIFAAGEFIPGLPVQQKRAELEQLTQQRDGLQKEVTEMQVYERRYADFKRDVEGLQRQLDTLKTIVPEEKEADEFIRLMQQAASASNVTIRRLTSQAVVPREFHFEMPFEVQADAPYFNILDFYARLSRLSRIINVGDLLFEEPDKAKGTKYPIRPGTTVSGIFTVTTFFTKSAEAIAPAQPAKPPGAQPGKP